MKLSELLYQVKLVELIGQPDLLVRDFHFDSRSVQPEDLFVAVMGTAADGHNYIQVAIAAGAVAVVAEELPAQRDSHVTYVRVQDSAHALGVIAANFYGNPSQELQVVGTTGTNGKTTVTTLLFELVRALGYPAGLISTVRVKINAEEQATKLTTPDPKTLHSLLKQMVVAGCQYCFMEVSSHAVAQQRIAGIRFAGGIFTNLTHDHLDFHGTFANYLKAKQTFFDKLPSNAFALTNLDDRNGEIMVQNTLARKRTYSLHRPANFTARLLENQLEGLQLDMAGQTVWFRLTGAFNAANLLAVYAATQELGLNSEEVLVKESQLTGVDGRFEVLHFPGNVTAIVDYAHTPDALKNVLVTARELLVDKGKLLVVIGCGGNRDAAKRPEMGRLAAELADIAVLTSDNPRSEAPDKILDQMEAGVPLTLKKRILRIEDRRSALKQAAQLSKPNDILVVAGKGHESYQEINGIRYTFDDKQELINIFQPLTQ